MSTARCIRTTALAAGMFITLATVVAHSACADALIITLDASESSPILGGDEFLRSAAAQIADKIRSLPPGSKVRMFLVGDDRLRAQLQFDVNVQRVNSASGATAAGIAKAFPQALIDKVAELKRKSAHQQSHLTTGFLDALHACVDYQSQKEGRARAERCEIVMLSDGAQFERGRIEYPRDAKRLPLAPIPGLDLRGVRAMMLGCGQGMDTSARVQVTARWDKWLREAGATEIILRRL